MDSHLEQGGKPLPTAGEHRPPAPDPHHLAAPSTSLAQAGPPPTGVMVTLVVLAVILMGYSVVAGVMGDAALAATAGAGAIALVGEIARRLLAAGGKA